MKRPPITEGDWTQKGLYFLTDRCPLKQQLANVKAMLAVPQLLSALETALSVIEDLPFPSNYPAKEIEAALRAAGYTE